jgi:hypothetical protein
MRIDTVVDAYSPDQACFVVWNFYRDSSYLLDHDGGWDNVQVHEVEVDREPDDDLVDHVEAVELPDEPVENAVEEDLRL